MSIAAEKGRSNTAVPNDGASSAAASRRSRRRTAHSSTASTRNKTTVGARPSAGLRRNRVIPSHQPAALSRTRRKSSGHAPHHSPLQSGGWSRTRSPSSACFCASVDLRQRRLAAGHPLGDAALEVEHGGALGQKGLLRRLDRGEDPGDLLEDRPRRLRRPRGVLGLGPRLLLVRQAGQAFLELRGPLRERMEPRGHRALPLHPELLRSLEPLERRLPPQNAQRPLELQLETSAFRGKLALDRRDLAARDPQRLERAQECLHLRGPRRHLRQRDRRSGRRGRRFLRS